MTESTDAAAEGEAVPTSPGKDNNFEVGSHETTVAEIQRIAENNHDAFTRKNRPPARIRSAPATTKKGERRLRPIRRRDKMTARTR